MKNKISLFLVLLTLYFFSVSVFALETRQNFRFDLSEFYQPDFERPRKYTPEEMDRLAWEVAVKMRERLNGEFNRKDPQHIMAMAEFFALTPREDLDLYSAPMHEGDIYYFTQIDKNKNRELYPQDAAQLAIQFYWEGLARLAAAHFKDSSKKNRARVSEIATAAMFDKEPGISVADAVAKGKETYDFEKLLYRLNYKGPKSRLKIR